MDTPLYGNPVRKASLSDGSEITFRRPTRAARDQAYDEAIERMRRIAKQVDWTPPDAGGGDADEEKDERTDRQKLLDSGTLFERTIILFDALESWTFDGENVFEDDTLTREVLDTAPDELLDEAMGKVWEAHVDYQLRHRKN